MTYDIGTGISLTQLLMSRALIQAGSGGGKSWDIRRMAEVFSGQVQQFIFDWEGEFVTLREKFPFIWVASQGADIPLVVAHAKAYAETLYFSNQSVIYDLSDIPYAERIRFVDIFLRKLMDFPLDKYHPLLVYLDEAHKYCPQQKAEIQASAAVIDIATMGRKREIGLILATQRISSLNKSATAECMNKFIGRTGQDVDQARALDELGDKSITKKMLRELQPGEFYCFGPALQPDIKKFRVSPVVTHHGRVAGGWKTPVPAELQEVIKAFTDLPQVAALKEKEEKDIVSALRYRVTKLEEELRVSLGKEYREPIRAGQYMADCRKKAQDELKEQIDKADELCAAARKTIAESSKKWANLEAQLVKSQKRFARAESLISRLGHFITAFQNTAVDKQQVTGGYSMGWQVDPGMKMEFPIMDIKNLPGIVAHPVITKDTIIGIDPGGENNTIIKVPQGLGKTGTPAPKIITESPDCMNFAPPEKLPTPLIHTYDDPPVQWTKMEKNILSWLFGFNRGFTLWQIGYGTGYSSKSGSFADAIRRLVKNNLIARQSAGSEYYGIVANMMGEVATIVNWTKMAPPVKILTVDTYRPRLNKCAGAILDVMNAQPHESFTKEAIGMMTKYSSGSGSFADALRDLRNLEMIGMNEDRTYQIFNNRK